MSKTQLQSPNILSVAYWREAVSNFSKPQMLVLAAIVVALRIAVKFFKIPIAPGLSISADAYVNAVGSLIYGPAVGLAVGSLSDTLGYIVNPSGPYFFPFIFTEMGSSFIYGLFFWKRNPSISRILVAKFTVNMICNVIMTSVFNKWMYLVFYGIDKAEAYNIINLTRIAKNLVLFPLESVLIAIVMGALLPSLSRMHLLSEIPDLKLKKRHYVAIIALTLFAVGLVLLYVFFLKDFVKSLNINFF